MPAENESNDIALIGVRSRRRGLWGSRDSDCSEKKGAVYLTQWTEDEDRLLLQTLLEAYKLKPARDELLNKTLVEFIYQNA